VPPVVQSQPWPSTRAVLLVHGVGNAGPGDYDGLVDAVKRALGPASAQTAIYQLFYDQINDWFATKTGLAGTLSSAVDALTNKINDAELGVTLAEYMGDILWPVLDQNARAAVREIFIAQVARMVADGIDAGVPARRQRLSIVCHSLGCFHTYEALHHMALHSSFGVQPASNEVVFDNVICMASPVQLIRTVADAIGPLVPNKRWLYTSRGDRLTIPAETTLTGEPVKSVRRWASITGELDPIGGFFFRDKADWAYAEVEGQESVVDDQRALTFATKQELRQALLAARREDRPPLVTPNDPHSWEAYVARNQARLQQWIVA
jgi:hypothetical protein